MKSSVSRRRRSCTRSVTTSATSRKCRTKTSWQHFGRPEGRVCQPARVPDVNPRRWSVRCSGRRTHRAQARARRVAGNPAARQAWSEYLTGNLIAFLTIVLRAKVSFRVSLRGTWSMVLNGCRAVLVVIGIACAVPVYGSDDSRSA